MDEEIGNHWAKAADAKARQEIKDKLNDKISLQIDNGPLSEAIEFIKKDTGLNLVLDPKALKEANIDPEVPVSITTKNISVSSALELLLRPLGLSYTIEDSVVLITTPRNAAQTQTVAGEEAIVVVLDTLTPPLGVSTSQGFTMLDPGSVRITSAVHPVSSGGHGTPSSTKVRVAFKANGLDFEIRDVSVQGAIDQLQNRIAVVEKNRDPMKSLQLSALKLLAEQLHKVNDLLMWEPEQKEKARGGWKSVVNFPNSAQRSPATARKIEVVSQSESALRRARERVKAITVEVESKKAELEKAISELGTLTGNRHGDRTGRDGVCRPRRCERSSRAGSQNPNGPRPGSQQNRQNIDEIEVQLHELLDEIARLKANQKPDTRTIAPGSHPVSASVKPGS